MAKYYRGEKIRINYSSQKIDLETGCKISVSTSLEDASTKDNTVIGWETQEVTTKSWNASADAKISNDGSNAAALLMLFISQVAAVPLSLNGIGAASGANALKGSALLTQLDIDAQVKQDATLSATFTGVGALS